MYILPSRPRYPKSLTTMLGSHSSTESGEKSLSTLGGPYRFEAYCMITASITNLVGSFDIVRYNCSMLCVKVSGGSDIRSTPAVSTVSLVDSLIDVVLVLIVSGNTAGCVFGRESLHRRLRPACVKHVDIGNDDQQTQVPLNEVFLDGRGMNHRAVMPTKARVGYGKLCLWRRNSQPIYTSVKPNVILRMPNPSMLLEIYVSFIYVVALVTFMLKEVANYPTESDKYKVCGLKRRSQESRWDQWKTRFQVNDLVSFGWNNSSPHRRHSHPVCLRRALLSFAAMIASSVFTVATGGDLRASIRDGKESCFRYFPSDYLFQMNCTVLEWKRHGYYGSTYISLHGNETFDGDGGGEGNIIDLGTTEDFHGLFAIVDAHIKSLDEAPLIRNVHVKNGKVAEGGGFIVQAHQHYFFVDSCSSTGNITGKWAGGICGRNAGRNWGHTIVSNSFSTGTIGGTEAGGIAGRRVGYTGGTVNITQCYSLGRIQGDRAGGICGDQAGCNGHVYVTQSYSTGTIRGSGSGGITGDGAAHNDGEVHISDCYTRGDIEGEHAGGVTGADTGGWGNRDGNVHIINTYASGVVKNLHAGGIIGHMHNEVTGVVQVQYSVYNGDGNTNIVEDASNENVLLKTGNSENLTDIRGQLYHYEGVEQWSYETWALNGSDALPILHFQLMQQPVELSPTKPPSVSRSATSTRTLTTRTPTSSLIPLPVQLPHRSTNQAAKTKTKG
eukprot:gb/GECG01013820.1/.p1 GENE.gb/GECG01013820.1/~~gb/GECG01013820.1/.p1  ORF type:complete len:724 (+),score=61.47 gb/GECG01013820.1/:1-2172(+)